MIITITRNYVTFGCLRLLKPGEMNSHLSEAEKIASLGLYQMVHEARTSSHLSTSVFSLDIQTLRKGNTNNCDLDEGYLFVDNRSTLQALWADLQRGNEGAAPLPEIDFEKRIVFLALMGLHSGSDLAINIQWGQFDPERKMLRISVSKVCSYKSPTEYLIQNPYHLVSIPRTRLLQGFGIEVDEEIAIEYARSASEVSVPQREKIKDQQLGQVKRDEVAVDDNTARV